MMLHPRMPETVKDNKIDPMCEEVGMVLPPKIKKSIVRLIPVSSTIATEGQESTKEFFPNQSTMHEGSFSMSDIVGTQTPLEIRSETDQLIGHKLVKALSNFKHDVVAPLSPTILCNTLAEKEAIVVSKKGNQWCNQKNFLRGQTSKVVRDLLTKKWIIIKANKQLGVSNLKQYRDTNAKLLSASNFKAFKQLAEMSMFLESIQKLAKVKTEKKKNMKKYKKKKSMTNEEDAPEWWWLVTTF
jgi:predicted house-cleaning noncanonical NTP pyrophosphatase (MazG superfamily)